MTASSRPVSIATRQRRGRVPCSSTPWLRTASISSVRPRAPGLRELPRPGQRAALPGPRGPGRLRRVPPAGLRRAARGQRLRHDLPGLPHDRHLGRRRVRAFRRVGRLPARRRPRTSDVRELSQLRQRAALPGPRGPGRLRRVPPVGLRWAARRHWVRHDLPGLPYGGHVGGCGVQPRPGVRTASTSSAPTHL